MFHVKYFTQSSLRIENNLPSKLQNAISLSLSYPKSVLNCSEFKLYMNKCNKNVSKSAKVTSYKPKRKRFDWNTSCCGIVNWKLYKTLWHGKIVPDYLSINHWARLVVTLIQFDHRPRHFFCKYTVTSIVYSQYILTRG